MRLLDADALEKTITEEFYGISATGFIRFMRDKTPVEVYNRVRDLIDNAPTIKTFTLEDIEEQYRKGLEKGLSEWETERPTGKWIYHKGLSESRECSVCGVWLDWSLVRNSFCPNCGADMRGIDR